MGKLVEAVKCAEVISEKFNITLADLVDVFAEIPTADVVEVVRCKDCIYFVSGICRQDLALNLARGDDYCSYGERSDT